MNTLNHSFFPRVKRLFALTILSWHIRDAEDSMADYRYALQTNRHPSDRVQLERLLRKAIYNHSMLCARRDVLRGQE